MRGVVRAILIGGALALCSQVVSAGPWSLTGKVIHVDDGDSLTILQADFSKTTVRLSDIDSPEGGHGLGRPGQPFSQAAKQSLVALAKGQNATATCYENDHWGRSPDGHPKLPHLWPVKLLQAGRMDYDDSGLMAMRAAASLRR